MKNKNNRSKIAIIGAGAVGTSTAFSLALQNIAADLILVDINQMQCEGELLDLTDALETTNLPFLEKGSYRDAAQSDIIVITAGKRQQIGQSREELLQANMQVISSILRELIPINPNAIILMVTNPVDILAYLAQKITQLPYHQVISSGTFLDSVRARILLSHKLSIAPEAIHAYILGQHGDLQVAAWSISHIAGTPITSFLDTNALEIIAEKTKNRAYEIIKCKGATFFGIAKVVAELCRVILTDQYLVKPLSCYVPEFQTFLSMPVVLARKGIVQILKTKLNAFEQEALAQTARKMSELCKQL